MSRYLLPCPHCQAPQTVGIAQAGSDVRCSGCGQNMVIPGTRVLRELPLATASGGTGVAKEVPMFQRIATAALLLISFVTFSYGGYLAYLRWTAPIEFGHSEEELYQDLYETSMSDPIARAWDHWDFLVDAGIPEDPEPPPFFLYNRLFELQKPWMIGFLSVGGLSLLAFVGLSVLSSRGLTAK